MSPLAPEHSWPPLDVCCPGVIPFVTAWGWQKQRVEALKQDPSRPDGLLLLSHPPVYTLGQGADPGFLKFDPLTSPYELHRIERGGEVTYHDPGQWVGYPVLNLQRHQTDLHWYLRQLEQVIIDVLQELGLPADRIPGLTGVWVEGYKLAAIGIKVSRWITFHGFALNIHPDMAAFERIVPCGIADRRVGSVAQFLPDITLEAIRILMIERFARVFQLAPRVVTPSCWIEPHPHNCSSPQQPG